MSTFHLVIATVGIMSAIVATVLAMIWVGGKKYDYDDWHDGDCEF